MGKLDQLRALPRRGVTSVRTPVNADDYKAVDPTKIERGFGSASAVPKSSKDGALRVRLSPDDMRVYMKQLQARIKQAEAENAGLKSVASTGKGKVVSTPTECPVCARRRKAKAKSMRSYRAKVAKKAPRPRRAKKTATTN
jgi:hypothetical protein